MDFSPLPPPVPNGDSLPYWNAAREGTLLIRKCRSCGARHFMPRHLCPVCWSAELDWLASHGEGTVHSFTIVHRAPNPVFAAHTPYVLAMIELDEGPRMLANVIGAGALSVAIDDRVRVTFEDRGHDVRVPQFERTAGAV